MASAISQTVGRFADVNPGALMGAFRQSASSRPFELVTTHYSGPTDFEGSCARAQSIVSGVVGSAAWDYSLDVCGNHLAAAVDALTASSRAWELVSVEPTADGYCFAFSAAQGAN
jgi:hypothetical protein